MAIRIQIADDHKMFREGLRSLLEAEPHFEVVAETRDGLSTVREALVRKPDVIIMDIAMPGLNGIEATRQILSSKPDTRIISVSMHATRKYVSSMIRAGAMGYLLKGAAFEELARAVRDVMAGKKFLSSDIAALVVDELVSPATDQSDPGLTARQREVLQLVAEGKSTKEIAALLFVSAKTIETHRRQIMDTLGIRSIAELTKYAIAEGITSTDF